VVIFDANVEQIESQRNIFTIVHMFLLLLIIGMLNKNTWS